MKIKNIAMMLVVMIMAVTVLLTSGCTSAAFMDISPGLEIISEEEVPDKLKVESASWAQEPNYIRVTAAPGYEFIPGDEFSVSWNRGRTGYVILTERKTEVFLEVTKYGIIQGSVEVLIRRHAGNNTQLEGLAVDE